MSRVPVHKTEEDAIYYHVAMYYQRVQANPAIRGDEDKHIALIEEINERYLKALRYVPPGVDENGLDYEKYKGAFIENMDFLTEVFTKKKQREETSVAQDAFRERNVNTTKYIK